MVNNSTNINITNNYISTQIKYEKYHDLCVCTYSLF